MRIFDDDDDELPRGTDGEIVIRPKRPHVMFEGYWGRPEATVETSRNWWYHTGDIGRIDDDDFLYFVDRKADYLRRRGENISSFEVERILMGHGALADVAVHAVPSPLTEDDLKVTARSGRCSADDGAALDRGGAVPVVHRRAAVLRAAALHRVPGRAAPQSRWGACSSASCATRASPTRRGTSRPPASPTRSAERRSRLGPTRACRTAGACRTTSRPTAPSAPRASAHARHRHVRVAGDVRHAGRGAGRPRRPRGGASARRAPRWRCGSPCGPARRRGSCARRGRSRSPDVGARSMSKSSGRSKARGSRVAAPVSSSTG